MLLWCSIHVYFQTALFCKWTVKIQFRIFLLLSTCIVVKYTSISEYEIKWLFLEDIQIPNYVLLVHANKNNRFSKWNINREMEYHASFKSFTFFSIPIILCKYTNNVPYRQGLCMAGYFRWKLSDTLQCIWLKILLLNNSYGIKRTTISGYTLHTFNISSQLEMNGQ